MTTITKEWLQQTIAEFENTRDDIPFGLSDDDAKILLVLKRALASLDAEPVRYLNKFSGTCVTLEQQSNAADDVAVYIPLYTAPPAPVVPEEAYSDDCPDLYASQPEAWAVGWNACRAALLQGAEPVSQTYELPQTQFGQIADLYEMQFDDGRTCAFHTDDAKAAQWLLACDGNKVQEYVRIERYQEAVIGNPPVTQDGWISCSERMPEDEQEVIVHNKLGYRYVSYFDEHSGLFFDMRGGNQMNCIEHILVTHWMPLPAAPEPEQS
ncbi:DUF551 domain-containing protein [Salmonella enterica subsp. enterica serovar Napoli]|nr:DUF551 domain-containing protein [Salmonella enterica]ECS7285967.1 DUF551 domain-containing protein [Salmonella enterica subsp. enterica serovar Napoli]